jgi:hypothetical protein
MASLVNVLLRTLILDDAAYQEWRERPNIFLRGIALIVVVTLLASLISFAVNLVNRVQPMDPVEVEQEVREALEMQSQWNPAWQDPQRRQMMEETFDVIVPMVVEISRIGAPLPQGVSGFFQAAGNWLSGAMGALGGWLFYGALVLFTANLLGGGARLREFYGMVALYAIPGLLAFFQPVDCIGPLLAFAGTVWGIVVYVKATSVVTGLDGLRSTVAVLAPAVVMVFLGVLLVMAWVLWLVIIF